jgi:hypothetical protein
MEFTLYRQFGALNSAPIFDAFSQGIRKSGYKESSSIAAIPVIWSVLWAGRMLSNKRIYDNATKKNVPVVIIEVGTLKRNITWRISVDHVNFLGYFGNEKDINPNRSTLFQPLKEPKKNRKQSILITAQRPESLQWQGLPSTASWIESTVSKIKSYTDLPIVIRPHPRSRIPISMPGVLVETPRKIQSTYDDFDINSIITVL